MGIAGTLRNCDSLDLGFEWHALMINCIARLFSPYQNCGATGQAKITGCVQRSANEVERPLTTMGKFRSHEMNHEDAALKTSGSNKAGRTKHRRIRIILGQAPVWHKDRKCALARAENES